MRPGSELFVFEQQHCSHARVVVLYLGAGFPKAPGIQEWNWNAAQSALGVARGWEMLFFWKSISSTFFWRSTPQPGSHSLFLYLKFGLSPSV